MSVSETESTMRDYLGALVKRGDFASFFSEDVVWTTMETGEEVRGREAVRDLIVTLHTQLFDASPEIRSLVAGDGVAALEAVFVGTHKAEFAGVPATGAMVRLPYMVLYELDGNRITVIRAYLSMLALVQQVQAQRPAGS